MNIFVNSRGYGGEADYTWHELTAYAENPAERPAVYEHYVRGSWIYAEDESYVLGRFGDEVGLLITGVISRSREDFLHRRLHDSILLIGSVEDEACLRGVAAHALRDPEWLPGLLDRAISFDAEQRFSVRRVIFDSMLEHDSVGEERPDPAPRIRQLSDTSRRELAEELQVTRLPSHHGFLVVVTTIQSLQKLVDAGIWRGLANGLRSEQDWDTRTQSKWRLW